MAAVLATFHGQGLRGDEEVWTASCAYGAPWRKEFTFLGKRFPLAKVHKRCPGFHGHIRVAGKIAKGTSEYTPLLAAALAAVVAEGIKEVSSRERDVSLDVDGPEHAAINELLLSCSGPPTGRGLSRSTSTSWKEAPSTSGWPT